jgi:hypothetical protein
MIFFYRNRSCRWRPVELRGTVSFNPEPTATAGLFTTSKPGVSKEICKRRCRRLRVKRSITYKEYFLFILLQTPFFLVYFVYFRKKTVTPLKILNYPTEKSDSTEFLDCRDFLADVIFSAI